MRSFTVITLEGDRVSISENDIICITAYAHGTTLRCTNGRTYKSVLGLSAFEDIESSLFRCHRGELINLKRVRKIRDYIELDEGLTVPVARRRRHSLITAFERSES